MECALLLWGGLSNSTLPPGRSLILAYRSPTSGFRAVWGRRLIWWLYKTGQWVAPAPALEADTGWRLWQDAHALTHGTDHYNDRFTLTHVFDDHDLPEGNSASASVFTGRDFTTVVVFHVRWRWGGNEYHPERLSFPLLRAWLLRRTLHGCVFTGTGAAGHFAVVWTHAHMDACPRAHIVTFASSLPQLVPPPHFRISEISTELDWVRHPSSIVVGGPTMPTVGQIAFLPVNTWFQLVFRMVALAIYSILIIWDHSPLAYQRVLAGRVLALDDDTVTTVVEDTDQVTSPVPSERASDDFCVLPSFSLLHF